MEKNVRNFGDRTRSNIRLIVIQSVVSLAIYPAASSTVLLISGGISTSNVSLLDTQYIITMHIGLFPGSFKPYHAGHHAVVEMAASTCDSVIVIPSMSDRTRKGEFPMRYADMRIIWNEHLQNVLPANVKVEFNQFPVRRVYEILTAPASNTFAVYGDSHDITVNFSQASQEKYFPELIRDNRVTFIGLARTMTRPISGSHMRQLLQQGKRQEFIDFLPAGLDGNSIWNILKGPTTTITAG